MWTSWERKSRGNEGKGNSSIVEKKGVCTEGDGSEEKKKKGTDLVRSNLEGRYWGGCKSV